MTTSMWNVECGMWNAGGDRHSGTGRAFAHLGPPPWTDCKSLGEAAVGGRGLVPMSGLQAQVSAQLPKEGPGSGGWEAATCNQKDPPQEAWGKLVCGRSASPCRVGGARRAAGLPCASLTPAGGGPRGHPPAQPCVAPPGKGFPPSSADSPFSVGK